MQAREKHADAPQNLFTQWKTIKILLRSKLFKRLTLCIMLTGIISEGLQDLMIQYLQLKLDFGIKDQVGWLACKSCTASMCNKICHLYLTYCKACRSCLQHCFSGCKGVFSWQQGLLFMPVSLSQLAFTSTSVKHAAQVNNKF